MSEELFTYFTTDNISGKKCTEKWLSKNNYKLYNDIIKWSLSKKLEGIEFKRKVYHYIHKLDMIKFCECGKEAKYKRIRDGYSDFCSQKCCQKSESYYNKWFTSWKKNNNINDILEKREKTFIKNYGSIENYKKYFKESLKKTMRKKYNVDTVFETPQFKKKRKETLKEKYGDATFNNKEKTKSTRISNGTQIDDSQINNFKEYRKVIINRTCTIFRNNEHLINPNKLLRGQKGYQIDHRYSVKQGFLNNIPIEIISHPFNLKMVWWEDNLKKQDTCEITHEELLKGIILYKNKIVVKHSILQEIYNKESKQIATKLFEKLYI